MVWATSGPYERASALMVVLGLHAAALALLLAQRASVPPPPANPGLMKIVSLDAAAPAEAPPPPPAMPSEVVKQTIAEAKLAMSTAEPADSFAPAGDGCFALAQVSDAVLSDPAALVSALNAPPETRSIAEAIVLWNQNWIAAANSRDAPLGPARAAVERGLASLPVECLDEPIAGPRLIPLPAGSGTIFLVFGSGQWSWRQVGLSGELVADEGDRSRQAANEFSLFDWFDWN